MKEFAIDPEMAARIELLKRELLIILLRRLGGKVELPVAEVDATDGIAMRMDIATLERTITLELIGRDGRPYPCAPVSGGVLA
ncbi:MAG TPA: hypothetical protein VGM20_04435 [Gemmatimonadales bacterium]